MRSWGGEGEWLRERAREKDREGGRTYEDDVP